MSSNLGSALCYLAIVMVGVGGAFFTWWYKRQKLREQGRLRERSPAERREEEERE